MPNLSTDRLYGLNASLAIKAPCKAATTANITLSGEQTIDGVALVAEDRVLVKNQTDTTKNGIYVVAALAWTRAKDFNGPFDIRKGTRVFITDGTTNARKEYRVSASDPLTIGTSAITFDLFTSDASGAAEAARDVALAAADASSDSATESAFFADLSEASAAAAAASEDGAAAIVLGDFTQVGTGAVTRTFLAKARESCFSVTDFGATGDGVTDDSAAIQAALDAARAAGNVSGAGTGTQTVYFPPGNYYCGSTTFELHATYHLKGEGRGVATGGHGTRLLWDAGVTGIITHQNDTYGSNRKGGTLGTAAGTIIEGLYLVGGWLSALTEGEHHGIQVRTPTQIRNCYLENWQGAGIYIVASSGSPDAAAIPYGNANGFALEDCRANGCRDGFYIEGADANAGRTIGILAASCRRHGIADNSFLGNAHINPRAQNITRTAYNDGTTYPAGMCHYTGYLYYVRPGEAVGASTNAPSGTLTDNTWWGVISTGTAIPGAGFPDWYSGISVREGYPYYGTNINATSAWIYPYREGGQPKGYLADSHLVAGIGAGFALDASSSQNYLLAASNRIRSGSPLQVRVPYNTLAGWTVDLGSSSVDTVNYVLRFADGTSSSNEWRLQHSTGNLRWNLAGTDAVVVTGVDTTEQFGTGAAVPRATWLRNLMIGSSATNARQITMATSVPASGAHAQGEFVINQIPTKAVAGWACQAAGTPGTWLTMAGVFPSVSADKGNANATLAVATSDYTNVWNTPLTGNRTCTLSTSGAFNGAKFRIVRTANATGAFNLEVGTGPLKSLAAGQWCDVEYDGSAWFLTAFGSL